MDWFGHAFAFKIRVDVEHVESQRYIGDYRLTKVSVVNLLDLLAELDVKVSFCVLGITAELFPNLIGDIVAAGHEVFGHGMYHEPALAGRPFAEQRHEMRRMRDSIEAACGIQVQGLGCPHHGLADEYTLRAAVETGIEYVESRFRAADSVLPKWRAIEGTDQKVLVPGGQSRGASDYTDRRPYWALVHEEAFSPEGARRKWMGNIDWAKENGCMAGLVVHPWMLMINAGEIQVVKDVIRYAVDQGAWMATVGGLGNWQRREKQTEELLSKRPNSTRSRSRQTSHRQAQSGVCKDASRNPAFDRQSLLSKQSTFEPISKQLLTQGVNTMSAALDYGVQSYCFRHFTDNADVAQKVKDIGLDKIEVCAVHADFDDPDGWEDTVKIYQDAGVAVISIGVQTFSGDPAEKSYFDCAAIAGAKHISCHFQLETYTKAITQVRAWSREYDIRVGIHCHGGYHFGGQVDVLKHLIGLGAPEIGLCIDTAWAMQIGPGQGNPVKWARDFAGQI